MNEFVEECRSEWRRLGVPDPVVNEMAAELAADLEEAEAEDASAEEVLGSGAFDPRSFAAAWAAERGVIGREGQSPSADGLPRRSRLAAALGAFALIAVIGAVLAIVASPSGPTRLAFTAPEPRLPAITRLPALPPGAAVMALSPDGRTVAVAAPVDARLWIRPDGPRVVTLRVPAPEARIAVVETNDSGRDTRTLGWVLLTVGLAGVVALAMFSLWARSAPRPRV